MSPKTLNNEQGFLLPLALFILVVMGILAVTISRTATQTSNSAVQELMNVQAFYAAESGAQRGMQSLFLNNTTRQATDAACVTLDTTPLSPNYSGVNGLKACSVQVTCSCRYQNGNPCTPAVAANYSSTTALALSKSFYTINSQGTCGTGLFRAVRTLEVGAFLEQQ